MRRSKTASLCKSCNFKSDKHFKRRHTWKYKSRFWESSNNVFADRIDCISLFAKDNGRSTSINKYDLPPPLDNEIYYGSMCLVKHPEMDELTADDFMKKKCFYDLREDEWEKVYEWLFGGFEELGEEDSEEEDDEEDNIPTHENQKWLFKRWICSR